MKSKTRISNVSNCIKKKAESRNILNVLINNVITHLFFILKTDSLVINNHTHPALLSNVVNKRYHTSQLTEKIMKFIIQENFIP